MKGKIAAVIAVLVLVGTLVADVWLADRAEAAVLEQQTVHATYRQMLEQAQAASLTVTEGGQTVGTYSLEELGLLQSVEDAVSEQFSAQEKTEPAVYAQFSLWEKLQWHEVSHTPHGRVTVDTTGMDTGAVWEDLHAVERKQAEDAYPVFQDGAFVTQAEQAGNMLLEAPIDEALPRAAGTLVITPDETAAAAVELTDLDCYILPQVTRENADFPYHSLLLQELEGKQLQLQFLDQTQVLDSAALAQLLTVDENGVIVVREEPLQEQVAAWAETYDKAKTPFLFNSYVGGYVPVSFLRVSYTLDQQALFRQLQAQLSKLDMTAVEAPMVCRKYKGDVLDLGDTYVEVDIDNQIMTYFKDGEVVVSTDVVTGNPNGHMTPRGLYNVYNRRPDCWLIGADYCVFVEYWVGIWEVYGIHDASWRSEFGGTRYRTNGSHGCVNTPTEPMKVIYDTIEIGTPVLIF